MLEMFRKGLNKKTAQLAKLDVSRARAMPMRLRRQKIRQSEFRELLKKKAEAEDMKEFLRREILVRIEAGLAEPTTTSLIDTSDISIVSTVNILDLADRMAEGRELFSGQVAARGMVMGWRLELDMLTTQE